MRTATIQSSHGELVADLDTGVVLADHCRYDDDSIADITWIDFAEWEKFWGEERVSMYDILDLRYYSNTNGYEEPEHEWRMSTVRDNLSDVRLTSDADLKSLQILIREVLREVFKRTG